MTDNGKPLEDGQWLCGLCKACEAAGLSGANIAPPNPTSAEDAPTPVGALVFMQVASRRGRWLL